MEEATENVPEASGDSAGAVLDDVKFEFPWSDMYKGGLSGTVDAYDRHVFFCYKNPDSWAPRVEASDTDLLPKMLSSAVKFRKDEITVKTKITVCGGGEGTEFADGDVLIYPEMIKYKGLDESNVDSFVEDVLVNGKPWASGVQDVLGGSHVFVCAHGSRDKRCGVCGPVLMDNLKQEIATRGLKDQVFVTPCSHIGGHKYAGNLIVYSPDPEGKITGHWYGYVTPNDVPEILDQHIGKGEIIERLWRGQMGAYVEEGERGKEQKLPNGKDAKKSKKDHESSVQANTESIASCCHGANGVSCCRDASSAPKLQPPSIEESQSRSRLYSLPSRIRLMILLLIIASGPVLATGDSFEIQWDVNSVVTGWGIEHVRSFFVGDSIVFHYDSSYEVVEVHQEGYAFCSTIEAISVFTDGHTVVTLHSPGHRYFICGREDHCVHGVRLRILVQPRDLPAAHLPSTAMAPPTHAPMTPFADESITYLWVVVPLFIVFTYFMFRHLYSWLCDAYYERYMSLTPHDGIVEMGTIGRSISTSPIPSLDTMELSLD